MLQIHLQISSKRRWTQISNLQIFILTYNNLSTKSYIKITCCSYLITHARWIHINIYYYITIISYFCISCIVVQFILKNHNKQWTILYQINSCCDPTLFCANRVQCRIVWKIVKHIYLIICKTPPCHNFFFWNV